MISVSFLLFFKYILFADDTNLICSGSNLNELVSQTNIELTKIGDWFSANLQSLNTNKTKFIIFSNKQKAHTSEKPNHIRINSENIYRTDSINFLGVTIDENLS